MRKIGGIVLAAGGSTRLGQPKQLLELRGETLVHAAVSVAIEGGCDVVSVVTGHARQAVEAAVAELRPICVHNEHWRLGMGGSLRCGLESLPAVSAVIVMACDQPGLDAQVIRSLIKRYEEGGFTIVASRYSGTLGIPALFDQSCFSELHRLPDKSGAKAVINADPRRTTLVEFPLGAFDLDTPEDLQSWRQSNQPLRRSLPGPVDVCAGFDPLPSRA